MSRRIQRKESADVTALGVVAPPPLHIESPHFEGSLALLFHCVREHRVNLLDVPLGPICESYFLYLLNAADQNLDEAAAALVALAYLLERKAWALLPTPEPEPELEEILELPGMTADLDGVIGALIMFQEARSQTYYRTEDSGDVFELPFEVGEVKPRDLAMALERILERAERTPDAPIHKARRSLADMMRVVLAAIPSSFTRLEDVLPERYTVEDAVYWFISILELVRLGQCGLRVEEEEILLARRPG